MILLLSECIPLCRGEHIAGAQLFAISELSETNVLSQFDSVNSAVV